MTSSWHPTANATTYPRRRGDWTIEHADGTYAAFSPETGTSVNADPFRDIELPALAAALDRGHLISYRVGRRAVIATGTSYIKVVRPSRLARVVAAHELVDATNGVHAPTVIASNPIGTIELTPMDGQSLHAHIQHGTLCANAITALARSLASMHGEVDPSALPQHQPDPPHRWIETVARVDRSAAHHLSMVAIGLPSIGPGAESVIHSDLHDKNIYVSSTGVGFIDLDGLSSGSAESDLANFSVHLKLRALEMEQSTTSMSALGSLLYDEYVDKRPLDRELAHAFEQHTWFRLACLYRLRSTNCRLVQLIVSQLSAH